MKYNPLPALGRRLIAVLALSAGASLALAGAPVIPANPGFEDGLSGWRVGDTMSQSTPEAARTGKLGLRVIDNDKVNGSSLYSSSYPVKAGDIVTLSFHARADADFLAVYLWPLNDAGRPVKDPSRRGDGLHQIAVKKSDDWRPYSLSAAMPEGTTAVSFWVHSWSGSTGTADLDDFILEGIAPGTPPLESAADLALASAAAIARVTARAALDTIPDTIPERAAPPVIILKLDDLKQVNGTAHHSWTRVTDYLAARNIKCGVGIICETLANATPAYIDWIRTRHGSGLVEFWFHGWDHATWKTPDGKSLSEFDGRPVDEQRQRFADSQKLAREKLGFAFNTFGPGGGGSGRHQDAATAQVMAQDPDMKVWLYPSPIDAIGRDLATKGKVTVLDRVWAVNLEAAVGQPSFQRFVAGYARNSDREYFVLQGHPTNWGGDRFAEFEKIIDFLVEQKAVFMTAREYAASLGGRPAQQVSGK